MLYPNKPFLESLFILVNLANQQTVTAVEGVDKKFGEKGQAFTFVPSRPSNCFIVARHSSLDN